MRMKSSPKLRPNGWDGLAAAVVLVLAVACAALVWTGGGQSGPLTAVVSADGETVDQVVLADLTEPEERTYQMAARFGLAALEGREEPQ